MAIILYNYDPITTSNNMAARDFTDQNISQSKFDNRRQSRQMVQHMAIIFAKYYWPIVEDHLCELINRKAISESRIW